MSRESLLKSISAEVITATELFMDNLDTVQINGTHSKVNVQDLVEDIVILSSFKAFMITNDSLKKSFIEFINDPLINNAYQKQEQDQDPLRGMSYDVFSNLILKYNNFNNIRPKFYDEYADQPFSDSAKAQDSTLIKKHFSSNSFFNKLHPNLRHSLLPTKMIRNFEASGISFFLLYIDCILRYSNVRYMEYADSCARKISIRSNNKQTN